MDLLDLFIIGVVAVSAINGYRRGAALQITTYLGLLIGLALGAILAPIVAGLFGSPPAQATVALVVLLLGAAFGDALGWVVGSKFWVMARRSSLGGVDAAGGSVVAAIAVLLAVWFVGFNLVNGPFPSLSRQIRGSAVVRGIDQVLPRPPSVIGEVRQLLNRFGFPEVFAGLPPAPAGPVKGPTEGEAAAAAAKASDSTVRIVGRACGGIQEGSGFVATPNFVVTNAHVVAGVQRPEVQEQNGGSQAAVTVLFDPRLDIAILRVETAPGPPLQLDPREEDRGTDGAVLGFPGGGSLAAGPAAVRRQLEAEGRDIYGRSLVRRDVYELQATVRPGNSGGPFVLLDGAVAGVVFAASTTDPTLGYAIASTEVIPLLRDAEGRTRAVSTQGCAR